MNDDELRRAVKKHLGMVAGPINDLTRDVYLRKLGKKAPKKVPVDPVYSSEDESISHFSSRHSSVSDVSNILNGTMDESLPLPASGNGT